jgi:hypothetical protein
MSTWYYTFQLSRIHCIETRSRGPNDVDLITFGALLNKRDQGHGSAVIPVFRNSTIGGEQITTYSVESGFGDSRRRDRMTRSWIIGPTEVRDGDGVDIVVTATNTNDSQLPTADQQKMDRLTIDALNIYYSWLLGQFVSGLGLQVIEEYVGTGGSAIASFLADPVGKLLGYEPHGPCNGKVLADTLSFTSRDLEHLEWDDDPIAWVTGPMETATVTRSYDDADTHPAENCGAVARTEIDVTIRRSPAWAMQKHNWERRVTSVRQRYPGAQSLAAAAGLRL